jgi:hypothetical protein
MKKDRDALLRNIIKQMRSNVPPAEEEAAGMSLEDPEVLERRRTGKSTSPLRNLPPNLDPVEPVPMSATDPEETDEDDLDPVIPGPVFGKRKPRTKIV